MAEWRGAGTFIEWRGHHVFVRTEGSGEPLLLVHGFPTASWDWCLVWPELVEHYRLITLDMIGYGFSDKPKDFDYSILSQADLCEAVLEHYGAGRYFLLAHDYGSTVAQELLARQRDRADDRIRAACLLNAGLFPESHRARPMQKLLASPVGPVFARLSSYQTFRQNMRRIWGQKPPSEEELSILWALLMENDGRLRMPQLLRYIAERRARRTRWVGALVHARAPVRFVNGVDDPVSGAHMVERYREIVPNPDVVELAGVGHYPQIEAPEAVLAATLEHFATNAAT